MAKYDDMSFSKAFAAARKEMGKGKTFTWKGKSYSTDYKEESKERKTTPAKSPAPRPRPAANRDEITMSVLPKTYQQATQESGARRSRNAASERNRRTVERARTALARASAESEAKDKFTRARNRPVEYTYEQWKNMSRGQRERAGLPVSPIGGALEFDRIMRTFRGFSPIAGSGPKDKTVTGRSSAKPPRFEDR